MTRLSRFVVFGVPGFLLAAIHACTPVDATPGAGAASPFLISIRGGTVTAPDSVAAGWTRVRVEEDGAGHILVVFRLPETATNADVAGFVAALDTAKATPIPGTALGGPEIGDTGEVVIRMTKGRYVLGCVTRGRDGRRHANAGEMKAITVADPAAGGEAAAPHATQDVRLVDFAYVGPERWPSGSHMIRVENRGRQDHQMRIARLPAGSSLRDWLEADDPGRYATPVAGVARLGPGMEAYLPVELPRGPYVLYCLVPDHVSGRPHIALGMFRLIQVD